MKEQLIPQPVPTLTINPRAEAVTGYCVANVIQATEPPLQRALRLAGVGYFKKKHVHKKMRKLKSRYNLREGFLTFFSSLFENYSSFEFFIIYPMIYLTKITAWVIVGSILTFYLGNPFICFGLSIWIIFSFAKVDDSYTWDLFEKIAENAHDKIWFWSDPINMSMRKYCRPIPESVVNLATEIGLRVPAAKFYIGELVQCRPTKPIHGVQGNTSRDIVTPPDPFLYVCLAEDSYFTSERQSVQFAAEEFVVAYWEKATWDSQVEFPTLTRQG